MRHLLIALVLTTGVVATQTARACDCPVWTADDVFARSTLLFIGRAHSFGWGNNQQVYEVLAVLKGTPPARGVYVADYGAELGGCHAIDSQDAIATVAITDINPTPSICDGSGNLLGHHDELGRFFELAGAKTTTLTGPAVAALLEPKLQGGQGDVWFVGAGPVGEVLEVAGRTVHVVDAIDGLPTGEIYQTGRVLALQELVFVELVGDPLDDVDAIVQVPADGGAPTLLFAFWKGGVIRIPEPK